MFSEGTLVALLVVSILFGIGSAVTAWIAFKRRARGRTVLEDKQQLEEWQRRGLLVLSDEMTAEFLSMLETIDPRRLHRLVRDIQRIIEDHEFGSDDTIELSVQPVHRSESTTQRRELPVVQLQVSYALHV